MLAKESAAELHVTADRELDDALAHLFTGNERLGGAGLADLAQQHFLYERNIQVVSSGKVDQVEHFSA